MACFQCREVGCLVAVGGREPCCMKQECSRPCICAVVPAKMLWCSKYLQCHADKRTSSSAPLLSAMRPFRLLNYEAAQLMRLLSSDPQI